jgi:hypothetical protein
MTIDPHSQPTSESDRLEAANAVKALIVANEFLEALVEELQADVSNGYARGYYHGRFKTYTG